MKHGLSKLIYVLPLLFLGCDPDNQAGGGVVVPPTSTPAPTPGIAIVGAAGGTVSLPAVAEITFPAGSVPAGTRVEVRRANTPSGDSDFAEVSHFLAARNISLEALEVLVDAAQPNVSVQVKINVGAQYTTALPAGQVTRVLALTENSSRFENAYSTYEILPVTINAGESTISFSASPVYFARRVGGSQLARFIVVTSPGS